MNGLRKESSVEITEPMATSTAAQSDNALC